MMPMTPATLYRMTRTDAGHGTFSEAFPAGRTVYVILAVHENKSVIIANAPTDIRDGDQIVLDGAAYRVTGSSTMLGAMQKRIPIERVDKPIVPLVADSGS